MEEEEDGGSTARAAERRDCGALVLNGAVMMVTRVFPKWVC